MGADTFGHSSTHVALLTGEVGLSGLLFARIDYQDFAWRTPNRSLEWLWRPSPSLGQSAEVFASAFAPVQLPPGAGRSGYYGDPNLLCFNLKCYNGDEARPIQDDPSLDDYNVDRRVDDLVTYAQNMAEVIQGENILLLQGDDFYWEGRFTPLRIASQLLCSPRLHSLVPPLTAPVVLCRRQPQLQGAGQAHGLREQERHCVHAVLHAVDVHRGQVRGGPHVAPQVRRRGPQQRTATLLLHRNPTASPQNRLTSLCPRAFLSFLCSFRIPLELAECGAVTSAVGRR